MVPRARRTPWSGFSARWAMISFSSSEHCLRNTLFEGLRQRPLIPLSRYSFNQLLMAEGLIPRILAISWRSVPQLTASMASILASKTTGELRWIFFRAGTAWPESGGRGSFFFVLVGFQNAMTVPSFLWTVSGPGEGICHLIILKEGRHDLVDATGI